ncbi:MAG: inosine/uridine-preferring nucleoside [Prolixibacteraceae bacterium]|nr:MAG: inosine/uridine-preferring nucleoside [Prolixibacteraceae bacterium]
MKTITAIFIVMAILGTACQSPQKTKETQPPKLKILIDTDANNELDDQHALAYAFLNSDVFDVVGVTVNNTRNGDGIQGQYDEALRIIRLFNLENKVPLFKGADKSYAEIFPFISENEFDGKPAVDFIIQEALKMQDEKLVLLPVGKLTNIALAIKKEPKIIDKVRVVWLGSNYPGPGEYNLDNDTTSVNPVIESGVPFEMVTVRFGQPDGTAAVTVTREEIQQNMSGKGPIGEMEITGRHGGAFTTFGDYSVNLFEHAEMYGTPPSRALFDMAAVSLVKNPQWGEQKEIPAPRLQGIDWVEQPENPIKIVVWENFNRDAIVNDFFGLLDKATPQ